ncbi:MAG: Type 1 glutamine amidotransferase-like domain-containing protein [Telluria sp.]
MQAQYWRKAAAAALFALAAQAAWGVCLTQEVESNNSDTTANSGVCSGTPIAGSIGSSSDVDWYKFDIPAGGKISVSLAMSGTQDFDWYLYPASGSYVASGATAANPDNGSYTASAAGTYYVKVKPYTGTGSYTLSITFPGSGGGGGGGGAVTGKVWLNGGGVDQTNRAIFVDGLRAATGKNVGNPDINSTSNCPDTNWATTTCPRVAVVTAAALNQADGVDKFTNDLNSNGTILWSYSNLFLRHGFLPKHILSHWDTYQTNSYNTSTQGQANIAIINQADVVYVIGGDQSRLARTFLKDDGTDSDLMAAIRTRYQAGALIYAGDSAGTAISPAMSYGEGISIGYLNQNTLRQITPADCPYNAAGNSCLTYPDSAHPDYGTKIKGFGFVPNAVVDTHFDNRPSRTGRLGRLLAALKNLNTGVGYGIDQNTALYLNGDTATVYGNGYVWIAEGGTANFPAASLFAASGVHLSLLAAGDRFKYSDRSITTTRAAITSPYYSGYADSADIFAVDANGVGNSMLTLTHMVDQTSAYNNGTAPADSANGDANAFTLKFYKDSGTSAYKTNGVYTIKKALIDVN